MSYDSISRGIVLSTICIQERDYYRLLANQLVTVICVTLKTLYRHLENVYNCYTFYIYMQFTVLVGNALD